MKTLMYVLTCIILGTWIGVPIITIIQGILGNLEQVELGLKILSNMLEFEFMVITCLFGIYTVLEEKRN